MVVPTYNRPEKLRSCLAALCDQSFSAEHFEVVVVDDGGTAQLDSVVEACRRTLNLTLLRQPNAGPAAARNRGAVHATGTFVAFTDDDCLPDRRWLECFHQRFDESPGCMLGGRTVNALPDNDYAEASQHLISYLYSYYGGADESYGSAGARPAFFASNNMAMPLELFHSVGGFDEAFPLAAGEDREFCDRWNAHGLTADYVHESVVRHVHEMNFGEFARQHFTYGRGAYHFHRTRRRRRGDSFFVEPLAFYSGLVRYPLSVRSNGRAWLQAGLLAFAQMANASGFLWERVQAGAPRRRTTPT